MQRRTKSEWFRLDSPIGEPEIRWNNNPYDIERVVTSDGAIIWFGCSTNWKKEKDGEWTKLTTNENAKPLEKYLPEIVYGEDRNYFAPCEIPIYEKLYLGLENNETSNDTKPMLADISPDFELNFCEKCFQMTNHLDGKCQKCKAN